MSVYINYYLYKISSVESFDMAFLRYSNVINVPEILYAKSNTCISITADTDDGFYKIGKDLNVPWMLLRLQESNHWDYDLLVGGDQKDHFSTLPQYWASPEESDYHATLEYWKGSTDVLSECWGVPANQIERYIVNWGMKNEKLSDECIIEGKAYSHDEFNYGDADQIFDFMSALGAVEPIEKYKIYG